MIMRPNPVVMASILLAALCHDSISVQAATSANTRQAFSILEKRCFECHGPKQQRNGLRLDTMDYAERGGDSLASAFAAGDSASSPMIQRVMSTDPGFRMPFEKLPLPEREIAVLRAWIDEGAQWPKSAGSGSDGSEHWAFNAPKKTIAPEVGADAQVRSPIDQFILAEVREKGLTAKLEADRYTLVRRLYLELVGLPPTPDEVLAFVDDDSDEAYERLLDQLFASPHYGERQARRWLDVARYADTNGYEKDRPRSIWPYRDWVIDAFNANMPFDQFVIEQLAGDLLPKPTESQLIATGFHRNAMLNEEGGIDAAEDRFKRTVDRTNTTSTVFLGLTMSCAQCHSHKFDPISRTEYYQFFAFLNNPDETTLRLADSDIEAKQAHAESMESGLNKWINWLGHRDPEMKDAFKGWRSEVESKASPWTIPSPTSLISEKGATMSLLEDGSVLAEGDIPNDDVYVIEFDATEDAITAIRLEVLPDESLPGGGPGRGTILAEGDFLLTSFEVSVVSSESKDEPISMAISGATQDYAAKDKTATHSLDGHADTGWSITKAEAKAHHAVFRLEEPLRIENGSRLRVTLRQDYIHQHTIGRFRIGLTSKSGDVVASGVPAELEAMAVETSSARAKNTDSSLERYYYEEIAEPLKTWRDNRVKIVNATPKYATTLVMSPRVPARETRIHNR
ncbi:MAG: DUF1549 domain-containing protein, partial [Candidatus Hydrogenedentota bacterium]